MSKVLHIEESTLTDRYQTTIPQFVRESLRLKKRDKIKYTINKDGTILISRTHKKENKEDPLLNEFLSFLATDIKNRPSHIRSIDPALRKRALSLVSNVEVDLDQPLSKKDE